MSERGGDVVGSGQPQQADREVAQSGHDVRPVAGAGLGAVFAVSDVADPVQPVLDLPVPADPGCQFVGAALMRAQVGDRVDGLGALLVMRLLGEQTWSKEGLSSCCKVCGGVHGSASCHVAASTISR